MKLLFASDIHGSQYYCEKLVKKIAKENPDRIVLLGDLLYHGPRNDLPKEYNPKAVITMLNGLKDKIIAVRGNCESEVDQMVLEFPVFADYGVLFVDEKLIYLTHGHVFNENNLPKINKGDILIHGHTHVQVLEKRENYTILNPGSVSIPKENTCHSYMIYENNQFTIKNIETGEEVKKLKI